MKAIVAILTSAALGIASSADWTNQLTRTPGNFPLMRPLRARYEFGWSGLNAGFAEADFSRTKAGLSQLHVRGGSTGVVRALWKMDTDSVSLVRPKELQPAEVVQNEAYSDETRKTTVVFGPEGVARTRETKPADEASGKTKKFKFTPVHDLQSALLFIRSQPLKDGDEVRLVVYPAAQAYLAKAEVLGHEQVKVAGRSWPAIKLGLKLQVIDKKLELEQHRKFKRAAAWLSDDPDRLLLKVESEVAVGTVWMELKSLQFVDAR